MSRAAESDTMPRALREDGAPQLRAGDIRSLRFSVARRGFDRDEVCRFLADVADLVESLEQRIEHLEAGRTGR